MIYFIGKVPLFSSSNWLPSTVEDCISYFQDKPYISVDTETQGFDCHSKKILSLQLGDKHNQYVIDCRVVDILKFKNLLESKKVILHNAKFDYKFLKKAGIILENIYDTMLAECVIYCGYEKYGYGLQALADRYCGVHLNKEVRGDFFKLTSEAFTDEQIRYGALDVAYLDIIKEKQEEKIKQYGLEYVVDLENTVVTALADIEYNGMILDAKEWRNISVTNNVKLFDLEVAMDTMLMEAFKIPGNQSLFLDITLRRLNYNYASPKQIGEILEKLLSVPIESTDDRTLNSLKHKHPFIELLLKHRELAKAISTYGTEFLDNINPITGRVHTKFWQVLNSGRVSSNEPNLQNIPADNMYRNCFKAREGFLWVSADYSAQEMMLMAEASGEDVFIDALNNGEDLHCKVGSMMFKRTIDPIKDKAIRTKVKTINFGKAYGMGPNKFADKLNIPVQEAYELFDLYAKTFPKLTKWLKDSGNEVIRKGNARTPEPCRRVRWFPELKHLDPNDYTNKGTFAKAARDGTNTKIQGGAANITKEALIMVRGLINFYNSRYKEPVAYLICTVHDAIDVEVRQDLAEGFSKSMERIMVNVGNKYVTKVSMKVDITITPHWQK